MFCGEEERVPDSVSGATDGESQDDFDLMESDCDEDYSELSAFCMWYIYIIRFILDMLHIIFTSILGTDNSAKITVNKIE